MDQFIAVHSRHHDVREQDVYAGVFGQKVQRLFPILGGEYRQAALLEQSAQGEDVAQVVIDQQHFLAGKQGFAVMNGRHHFARALGQVAGAAMQEQRHFFDQTLV